MNPEMLVYIFIGAIIGGLAVLVGFFLGSGAW